MKSGLREPGACAAGARNRPRSCMVRRGLLGLLLLLLAAAQGSVALARQQPQKGHFNLLSLVGASTTDAKGDAERSKAKSAKEEPWVEVLSWHPRAFLYHGFMSEEECNHVVAEAKPIMRRSTVVGGNGESVQDKIRTSYGTFLRRLQDPVVEAIETRLATWTKLDIVNQEDMQILRYSDGQKYGAHYDSLDDQSPRVMTVLMYLGTNNLTGGETAFPEQSVWLDPNGEERHGPFSDCAKGHVAVRPKKGDALLFYSLKPDGSQDPQSMHTGCPVLWGVKWTATKWIHTKPFNAEWLNKDRPTVKEQMPEDCEDVEKACPGWADKGECDKNPGYMKGDAFTLGACRLSCKVCIACKPTDDACRQRNRLDAGFLPLLDDDTI